MSDPKADLLRYLQQGREGLLRKLDGLSSYDARRPMTPTGTNILGLVKHVAGVQWGYFGVTFGRPFPEKLAWEEAGAEIDDDMWARPDESVEDIVGLFHRSSAHADSTIEALPLDTVGHVRVVARRSKRGHASSRPGARDCRGGPPRGPSRHHARTH